MEKTQNIYIGIRKDDELMNELGFQYHLNENLQKSLRTTAMSQGIKKTEQRRRLEFYKVGSIDNVRKLQQNKNINMLVYVDGTRLGEVLNSVNSKYPGRMDYATAKQYKKELAEKLGVCLQKIGKDTNVRKEVSKTPDTIFKVGDWIKTPSKLKYGIGEIVSEVCRVYKVSKKSYWVELPIMNEYPKGIACGKFAREYYNNVTGLINETNYQGDEDWTIPYEDNKEEISFVQIDKIFRSSNGDDMKLITDKNRQGYSHEYIVR